MLAGTSGVRFLAEIFSSRKQSRPILEFTQPHIQCVHVFFPRGQSGRGVKLTTYIHLARRIRMSGDVRLLPPVCLCGMDRDNFTLRDCHVLGYFGPASLVDTLLWFILIIEPKERQTRLISSLLISFILLIRSLKLREEHRLRILKFTHQQMHFY